MLSGWFGDTADQGEAALRQESLLLGRHDADWEEYAARRRSIVALFRISPTSIGFVNAHKP
jgi:hypothetical protein